VRGQATWLSLDSMCVAPDGRRGARSRGAGTQLLADGSSERYAALRLFLKGTRTLVGRSDIHNIDWSIPKCEIGYWARSRFARRGYITEAVAGITTFAFETLGAQRVEIRCDADNERSAGVPRRLGFVHEATLRNDRRHPRAGKVSDTLVFAKTRMRCRLCLVAVFVALSVPVSAGERDLRIEMLQAIAREGRGCRSLLPEIRSALTDEDGLVRVEAALALHAVTGELAEAVTILRTALESADRQAMARAAQGLASLGAVGIGALVEDVGVAARRSAALLGLSLAQPEALAAVPALPDSIATVLACNPSVADVRSCLRIAALSKPTAVLCLDAAMRYLQMDELSLEVLRMLGSLGPVLGRSHLDLLARYLKSDELSWSALREVAALCGAQGRNGIMVVLLRLATAESDAAASALLDGLTAVSPDTLVPLLSDATRSERAVLRRWAAVGLEAVKGGRATDAFDTVLDLLDDPDADVRSAAARATARLARVLPDARRVDALVAHLSSADPEVRAGVVEALAIFAGEQPDLARLVVERLKDGDRRVRAAAVGGVGALGPAVPDAIPLVIDIVRGDGPTGRAVGALVRIAPMDERVVGALIQLLDDSRPAVQVIAAESLGATGASGAAAAGRLHDLSRSPHVAVRVSVRYAMWRIGGAYVDLYVEMRRALLEYESLEREDAAEVIRILELLGADVLPLVPHLETAIAALDDSSGEIEHPLRRVSRAIERLKQCSGPAGDGRR